MVLCAACNSDDDDATGRYIDYHAEYGLQECGHTKDFLNDFVPFLADELGLDIESLVDYAWVGEAELDAACPRGSLGCQKGTQIHARHPALPHEVVHAVTEQAGMNSLPFFTEGLAVAYDPWGGGSAGPRFMFRPEPGEPEVDPRGYMTSSSDLFGYKLAGAFVTFLLLRHGPAKFVALSRRLTRDITYPALAQLFGEIYEVALDDEAEVFIANDYCDDISGSVALYDCATPAVEWGASGWSWGGSMDCADDDVIGGIGDPEKGFRSQRSVSLEVPTSGQYDLVLRSLGEEKVNATLGRCFGCPWHPWDIVVRDTETQTVELSAGRHFLRITAYSDEAADFEVSLTAR